MLKHQLFLPPAELHGQDPVRGKDPARNDDEDEKEEGHVEDPVKDG